MFSQIDAVRDAIRLTPVLLVVANIAGVGGYVLKRTLSARHQKRDAEAVTKTIREYFCKSGVGVSVECIRLAPRRHFTVVIESEPMKRFRLSHIIESTLREHVRKTCGIEVEKVYWRFPIKDTVPANAPQSAADDYINEGLEHYRHIPKPEVTELPWEQFEKMSTIGPEQKNPAQ